MLAITIRKLVPTRSSPPDVSSVSASGSTRSRSFAPQRLAADPDDGTVGSDPAILDRGLTWADTVDLSEVTWVSGFVPSAGRGRATVHVTNGPERGIIRYAVSGLDAQTENSNVSGRLVADVGATIAIRDLEISAAPLDFALVHELFGADVPPAPWDGLLRGRLRATGGALDRWRIDPVRREHASQWARRREGDICG